MRKILRFVKPYWILAVSSLVMLIVLVFLDLAIPRLIQQIIDQGIKKNSLETVINTSLLMLGISVVSTVFAVGNNILSVRTGESVARDLREAIFLKIQGFSYANLDQFTTGKLIVRLTSDVGAVQRLVQVSLRIGTRAPLMMVGSIILMFNTSSNLALILVPLLLVTLVVIIFFSLKMEPLFKAAQQKLDNLNTVLQENISGARLVKAFVRADFEGQRFETANEAYTGNTVRVMQFMSSMSPILTIFVNIGMVIVIWAGGLEVINDEITIGQIVAFTNYLITTMTPLTMMSLLSTVWANGLASAQRINEVLDTIPDIFEDPQGETLPDQAQIEMTFKHVAFHYNGSNETAVLEDINLTAKPGETVAILGATGAGKTSLVNLIPRFYDATSGQILINGVDIRHIKSDSLLAQVGIVPQETILFSGSILDNIRYGRPQASMEQAIAAAKAAQAHEFIQALPNGYETHIEERGTNLSGGQKQRIAIARALLTEPKILILDDSTSSVDVETETEIQQALDEVMQGRTCFVVAQRISTVINADKIVVIDQGRIAAEGTHSELLKSSRIYQEIYDSQLGNGIQEHPASGAHSGGL